MFLYVCYYCVFQTILSLILFLCDSRLAYSFFLYLIYFCYIIINSLVIIRKEKLSFYNMVNPTQMNYTSVCIYLLELNIFSVW